MSDYPEIDKADRAWLVELARFQEIERKLAKNASLTEYRSVGRPELLALVVKRRAAVLAMDEKQTVGYLMRERLKKAGHQPPPWPEIPKSVFHDETATARRKRHRIYRYMLDDIGVPKLPKPTSKAHLV